MTFSNFLFITLINSIAVEKMCIRLTTRIKLPKILIHKSKSFFLEHISRNIAIFYRAARKPHSTLATFRFQNSNVYEQ